MSKDASTSAERQLVVFELAGETYGVDIGAVSEIGEMRRITTVPGAPAFIEGIVNLRGQVIPVVDLRKRFNLEAREISRQSRIIVVEIDGQTIGVIVDAVTEVLRVNLAEIEPPSPVIVGPDTRFIEGVAKVGNRLVIILDLTKVLTDEETAQLETVM